MVALRTCLEQPQLAAGVRLRDRERRGDLAEIDADEKRQVERHSAIDPWIG
jgi:hypothetical protein